MPATTLTWKSASPMKPTRMILAALLTTAVPGAWAQAPFPQMVRNQSAQGTLSTQSETGALGTLPYSSQANFTMMENASVPQSTVKTTSPSYIGVLGEKWETDKRGRRSTFLHNGQEMSVGYEPLRNEPEPTTQMRPNLPSSLSDSLAGKLTTFPTQLRIGKPLNPPPKK